jgi:hypothetical protein
MDVTVYHSSRKAAPTEIYLQWLAADVVFFFTHPLTPSITAARAYLVFYFNLSELNNDSMVAVATLNKFSTRPVISGHTSDTNASLSLSRVY